MTVSSRSAVMDRGRIVQVSTPGELYEYPNSRYVADFIGEVNILEGRVAGREGDHLIVQSAEAGCTIVTGPSGDEPLGSQVWIALRPEKLMISKDRKSTRLNSSHSCASRMPSS